MVDYMNKIRRLTIAGWLLISIKSGVCNAFTISKPNPPIRSSSFSPIVSRHQQRRGWHMSVPQPSSVALSASSSFESSETVPTTDAASATTRIDEQQHDKQQQLQDAVTELKQVLWEEYTSMFNPMRREFYASDVTFDDPLNSLSGVDQYQQNVDLLGSRTWLGAILFDNSNIVLHSVEGGDVVVVADKSNNPSKSQNPFEITEITTRWTLSMTFQALPWKPMARFTGISIYQVEPVLPRKDSSSSSSSSPLVRILRQQDYWDSINLQEGGTYQKVSTQLGLQDLLQQLFTIPSNNNNEDSSNNNNNNNKPLPFQLLRRAKTYQIRRYPSFTAAVVESQPEQQSDHATTHSALDTALDKWKKAGIQTLLRQPVIANMSKGQNDEETAITSWWVPLSTLPSDALSQQLGDYKLVTIPSQVIAAAEWSDKRTVAQVDQQLRAKLAYDGIQVMDNSAKDANEQQLLTTTGEVWIRLPDGSHPWSN